MIIPISRRLPRTETNVHCSFTPFSGKSRLQLICLATACLALLAASPVLADEGKERPNEQAQVMRSFQTQEEEKQSKALSDRQKHRIMFLLGAPLLLILLVTGGLGVAMGVYGRQVFVLHMILAGLAITLAIVHAIVGFVWFYPF